MSDILNINSSALSVNSKFSDVDKLDYMHCIEAWNQTEKEYPSEHTIQTVFEEQVEQNPNHIVLVYEKTQLTYKELNEKANQLAHYLKKTYQVQPDTKIALCLERSEVMLIAILAVLKAGGAYVPIDPTFPQDRIQYILQDADTPVLLTDEMYLQLASKLKLESKNNPVTTTKSSDLAYVMYTSGTTGKPKGVMIEHKSVINTVFAVAHIYDFTKGKKTTAFTAYTFDISVSEFFSPLLRCGELHLLSARVRSDAELISEYIINQNINYICLSPVMLSYLPRITYKSLIAIIYVGESCPADIGKYWSNHSNLYNCFGPTETTIYSTVKKIVDGDVTLIGTPIANTQCYVLDANLNQLPIGEEGELHIGGDCLARGYLNRPELTAEKFIPNPFQKECEKKANKNARLYKTGDLAKWRSDGNLEYIGRTDFQVKIRGFRIELGEIESVLTSYEEDDLKIIQSVVLAKERKNADGAASANKYLIAYYVSKHKLDEKKIFVYLKSKLPEYMVPSALVHLEKLPLTTNGKIDRRALPEPEFKNSENFIAPRTELEKKISQVWTEILGLAENQLSITDDFFGLGGNSVLAIRIMSKLNQTHKLNINVSVLFKQNTIEKLAHHLQNTNQNADDFIHIPLSNVSRKEEQSLSFAQERLWFIEKYEAGTNVYNLPLICKLSEHVQLDILERALTDVVSRHEILKTLIKEDADGNSYQFVSDEPLKIHIIQVQNKTQLDEILNQEIGRIYRLDHEYPIRVCVYEMLEARYISIVVHHIAFDGWSVDLLLNELDTLYSYHEKKLRGLYSSNMNLPHLSIQYKDFALWQKKYLTGDVLQKQLNFWKNKLSGYETLNLRTDKPRPSHINYEGEDIHFEFDTKLSLELRELAKNLKVSLYSLLLSGYFLMLKSYTYQDDLIIGTPIANRHYHQIENLIGFFVNSLALRIQIDSEEKISEFIQRVGNEIVEIQSYQDLPFEKLVSELNVAKDASRHPLFQVMFGVQNFGNEINYQNSSSASNLSQNNITSDSIFKSYDLSTPINTVAKFDLTTLVDDSQTQLKGVFNYATSLYAKETILQFIDTYIEILKQFVTLAQSECIKNLEYISQSQYAKTIAIWNQTEKEYPRLKTIHSLFEEQVEKTPDSFALIYENTALTYRQLNEKSNQLAHYLKRTYTIQPDTLVALCLARSEVMLIAILAVLKAGGAYVPVDPNYPSERIQYILQDTHSALLLTDQMYQNLEAELLFESKTNLNTDISSSNIAYVIYTSGTTGKPKGVMVEHKGVINTIIAMCAIYDFTRGNKVTAFTSYTFDASVLEFWTGLLQGGELHLLSEKVRSDLMLLDEYILKQKINYLYLPPVLFPYLSKQKYESVCAITYGGEQCDINAAQYWSRTYNLYNCYGPTESSIIATNKRVIDGDATLIGSPIANTQCYVLNKNLKPVPIGAVGELYIGGAGVARGYLNQASLTAEKFIPNPFQTEHEKENGINARLYKTEDLVRWLPDGNLEYIGRTDFQVKIRGFRIELGEIESALLSFRDADKPQADITQCVVLAKEYANKNDHNSHGKYLVGYYVCSSKLDEEKLFAYLRTKLPEYMIPAALVYLEKLPLTVNGKIDRRALPEPIFTNKENFVAPRSELDKNICKIWADVLKFPADSIGIRDDFFRLGGDSIISIQLVSRLRQHLKFNITVKDIFNHKTIEKLCDHIIYNQISSTPQTEIKTEQGQLTGTLPLLPIQNWFFKKEFVKPNHWNQSFLIKVPELDMIQLELSIKRLVEHHDSFSLRFRKDESSDCIVQYYDHRAQKFKFNVLNIASLGAQEGSLEFDAKLQEIYTEWQSDFDGEAGHLASIAYIHGFADGSARIYFALHHLIVDAVSWRILAQDLQKLYYTSHTQSEYENVLGLKGSSYRQWSYAIIDYAKSHETEKIYWKNVLSDHNPKGLDSLLNVARGQYSQSGLSIENISLSEIETQKLLKDCNHAYRTHINDLLLSALAYALSSCINYPANHILLEAHGREEIDPSIDITQQVGWFTTMYPVRLEVKDEVSQTIQATKENLRKIPNKGIGYGALFGYEPDQLPQVAFNYLGQFDSHTKNVYDNTWRILSEPSGLQVHQDNALLAAINIDGSIFDGQLQFTFMTQLSKEKTALIANNFRQKLQQIIQHTSNLNRTYLTPSDIDFIISRDYLDRLQESSEIEAVYIANSLQQGFVFHALNQGDIDDAYCVQMIWKYENQLDVKYLRESWVYAQKKYPSLRLRFGWDEQIVQIIDKESNVNFQIIDLSAQDDIALQQLQINQILKDDRTIKFDLKQSGLFRICLIKQKTDEYTCIFTNHHAILDGWSNPTLLEFVHATYLKLISGEKVSINYDNSYHDSQKYLQKHGANHLSYWNSALYSSETRSDLSVLLKRSKQHIRIDQYKNILNPEEQTLIIEHERVAQLKRFGQKYALTLNAILQYVWHKVLHIYGNSAQTVVGTTISGRNLPVDQIEDSVGLYINTLPLIFDHSQFKSVISAIKNIQDTIHELNSAGSVNLAQLQKDGVRLFDSMFVYENYPKPVHTESQNALKINFQGFVEKVDYPLAVMAYENNQTLVFSIKYAGELFEHAALKQLLSVIDTLISQMNVDLNEESKNLTYLTQNQYQNTFEIWNKTEKEYPIQKTIHQLFEAQVKKTPYDTAVVYENAALSYFDLNEKANQLAHFLIRTHDIKPDTKVALCLERSETMIIAILGVLKAGGAYVPISPNYPPERIEYIFKDTNSPILLTDELYHSLKEQLAIELKTDPLTTVTSSDLAYVIYTSGTTGNPKGVMIEHKGVVNLLNAVCDIYDFSKGKNVAAFAAYTFDPSVKEYFVTLLNGAKLHLLSDKVRTDILELDQYIIRNNIHYLHIPPVLLSSLPQKKYDSLYAMIYGGETCDSKTAQYWSNNLNLYNCYGPTETTVEALNTLVIDGNVTLIGSPIANAKCYVLDENFTLLPIGAIGELYIGGIGLARGYLNQPDLTAERFILNPFQTEEEKKLGKNEKIYKTGDLVRWKQDGRIEYIGRTDFQVKIRGFRIELEEIENVLNNYTLSPITQSIVLAKQSQSLNTNSDSSSSTYLVAYYTSDVKLDEEKILNYLSAKLPDYMVPSVLVHLEKIPLTINGKIDTRALPEPKLKYIDNFVSPRNETEKNICLIFSEILGLPKERIGVKNDFFRLGGNSILAIRLMSQLNKTLNLHMSVSDIFKYNTIEKISQFLANNSTQTQKQIHINASIVNQKEEQLLSFAQERLWFIERYEGGTHAYNIPIVCKLLKNVQSEFLKKSIQDVISRHEILRTKIGEDEDGNFYQCVNDAPLEINTVHVQNKENLDLLIHQSSCQIFNLKDSYPIRVCIYEIDQDKYISIVVHHIAFDGWSLDLFLKELETFYFYYENKSKGVETQLALAPLSIQYKDFALWQRNYLTGETLNQQLHYWKSKLSGYELLSLKTDKLRPAQINYEGKNLYFEFDAHLSSELRKLAKDLKVSLYTLLLSGYFLMLRSYSHQNDLVIGMPIANRHYSQIENLIGFFVNSLALRIQIDSNESLSDFIQKVGSEIIEAQNYQDLPFEKLVAELNLTKDTSRHPIFQIMFGVQSFGKRMHRNSEAKLSQLEEDQNHSQIFEVYEPSTYHHVVSNFDLSTFIDDSENQLRGEFNYATSLFHESTIAQFVETYTEILKQLTNFAQTQNVYSSEMKMQQGASERRVYKREAHTQATSNDAASSFPMSISDLKYLTDAQYRQIVETWNDTEREYSSERTIHSLFEEQVQRTQNNIAVSYENKSLTYQQLNEKANELAHYLRNTYHVQPDSKIALCMERSEVMLIAILGILKAGGAYVPIDPKIPAERIEYILKDTNSPILFTNEVYAELTPILIHEPKHNPMTETTKSHLAYVIYTSGTTGNPKGVMIEHSGIVNRIQWMNNEYPLNEKDIILQKTPYVFDVSVWELLWANLYGAQILFAKPEGHRDPEYIKELICEKSVTIIHFVPSMLTVFLEHLQMQIQMKDKSSSEISTLNSLKYLFCSGEALGINQVQQCHRLLPQTQIHNLYGPTEASVDVLYYDCTDLHIQTVCIGKPIDNTTAYVLDDNLTPLPVGAAGELYIGGVGLARGYLNRPDLTSEKFIPNPFQTEREKQLGRNARIYKTGDLVRWRADGNIEYIGRTDFQVKIRGFRIELGEIENALMSFRSLTAESSMDPAVKPRGDTLELLGDTLELRGDITQSIVLAKTYDGADAQSSHNKYLVGYYISAAQLNEEQIFAYLRTKLPEYMIPTALVHLSAFPLTVNGKIDRKALPEPKLQNTDTFIPPSNETEKNICKIWSEVLGISEQKVGIKDDFFRLGGNSILAIRVVGKINKLNAKNMNVSVLFKYSTVEKLAQYLADSTQKIDIVTIQKANTVKMAEHTLSFAQERLWFIEKYAGGTNAYNIPMVFKISAHVCLSHLEQAIQDVFARHEILRTLIREDHEGNTYQFVDNVPLVIHRIQVEDRAELDSLIYQEINYIYNLSAEYPIRVCVYELDVYPERCTSDEQRSGNFISDGYNKEYKEFYTSIIIHHIAFDGWSIDLFLKEIQTHYDYYERLSNGLPARLDLPDLTIQYKDFAIWQRNYLTGDVLNQQLDFWKKKLGGYETLHLRTDHPRPSQISYKGKDIYFEFDSKLSCELRELAKELKVSLYSLLLSGYFLMLRSYSYQNDLVIGTPIANRHYAQIENLIGFFVNSIPIRIEIDSKESIVAFIQRVGKEIVDAQSYQDLPFEKLVAELNVTQDASRHPIFQIMFGVQNFGRMNDAQQIGKFRDLGDNISKDNHYDSNRIFELYEITSSAETIAKFDLSTFIDDSETQLKGIFNYATSLYTDETVSGFLETYLQILKQFSRLSNKVQQGIQLRIGELEYLTQYQYTQTVEIWNRTQKEYPAHKTIQKLFEQQVEKTPNSIALVYEKNEFTYQQLNQKSNQLAHYLKNNFNVRPDTKIALCLQRSEVTIIAILAVLKAGGAYVPIDPNYPAERIAYIVQDTHSPILFTDETYFQLEEKLTHELESNPETETTSAHLAYVIYTSGTTGAPKGVMIEHKSIVNLLTNLDDIYDFTLGSQVAAFASYTFDPSVKEYFVALLRGGTLHLLSEKVRTDIAQMDLYITNHKINYLHIPPVLLSNLPQKKYDSLFGIIYGGETCEAQTGKYWSQNCNLYNCYGPTETTIEVVHKRVVDGDVTIIGTPVANTQCYVLDTNLNPLPIGAVGELYIGGTGLSRGYLNQSKLTEKKFIANPFQTETEKISGQNARLYKTDDLVRWLPDGNLEYIGRTDFQVKIRGFRIELGEIENALLSFSNAEVSSRGLTAGSTIQTRGDITQSVVIAKESAKTENNTSSTKYLVGYYVSQSKLDEEKIFNYLQSKLPDYMIPTALVHLDKLPLTLNGKINTRALPEPELLNKKSFVAPRDELEKQISQLWCAVLGIAQDQIGIHDDFFRLGGNSILAIRLMSKMNAAFSKNMGVSVIFKENTIAKFAQHLRNKDENNANAVVITQPKINRVEEQLLSFAQERLWFIEKYSGGTNAYNIPMVFKLSSQVQIDLLENSLKSIIARHEVLRTKICEDDEGNTFQRVYNEPLIIQKIQFENKEQLHKMLLAESEYIYNLSREYPVRICIYELRYTSGEQPSGNFISDRYISIMMHHIAFDGWSIDLFLSELEVFYHYYEKKQEGFETSLNLPALNIQYKDFALWQRAYLTGDILNSQIKYWKDKLSGYENLNLKTDKVRPLQITYDGKDVHFEFDAELSLELRELAKELNVSLYSLLLSGYFLMLKTYSYQKDIVIGTPIANRQHSEIENLIGFFVNSLALRVQIDSKESTTDFIQRVGREIVEAQNYQDLPFEKLVSELDVVQDKSRHPIFQVMFGVQSFGNRIQNDSDLSPDISNNNSFKLFKAYEFNTSAKSVAKFDLTTFIDDSQIELKGVFNYATNLYNEDTIFYFIETYIQILKQFIKRIAYISNIQCLTDAQYKQTIDVWNQTERDYDNSKTIHQMFEEQVEKTPNNVALVYEDITLSYAQLNEQSNRLAHYLKKNYQIKPDTLVALCMNRTELIMIGILGVLKAGGAYVPIDPNYPPERTQYILNDINSPILLTDDLYKTLESELQHEPITNLNTETTTAHLAYVIYTSGTTGKPKGVMVEHKGVVNLLYALESMYDFTMGLKVAEFASYVFDPSVKESFIALTRGAELHILSERVKRDVFEIEKYLVENKINYLNIAPAMLSNLPKKKYESLYGIIYGGEICDAQTGRYWSEVCKIYNCYGPTETTIEVLNKQLSHGEVTIIGAPIANTKCYVLDENLKPLPIGALGELYIGGVCLARGYLNQPALTAEKFIPNPFQTQAEKQSGKNSKIYKTQDLVRRLSDGNLEYIGRTDFQVKIRGFRIELEEIENVLLSFRDAEVSSRDAKVSSRDAEVSSRDAEVSSRDAKVSSRDAEVSSRDLIAGSSLDPAVKPRGDIGESIVIAKEHKNPDGSLSGNKYLVGYYVSHTKLNEENIFNYLHTKLPSYMVPTALVHLERLPLTINGKVDKRALPEPEFKQDKSFIAPRNALEKNIVSIWSEILVVPEEKIGVCDDFFRLGGNSILAIRLMNKINKALAKNMSVSVIFEQNTIEKLAQYLNTHQNGKDSLLIPKSHVTKPESQCLSFAQERLWFIEKFERGTNAYNIPMVFKLSNRVDLSILEMSIKDIIARHEILRTVIKEDKEGNTYQFICDEPYYVKRVQVLDESALHQLLVQDINHIYALSDEYPIRVCVYEMIQAKYARYMSMVVHHIAFDGWSVDLFFNELKILYSYYEKKSKGLDAHLVLPDLSIQYKDFALWQKNHMAQDILHQQLNFWKNKLSDYENLNLKTDKPRPSHIDYKGRDIYFELDAKLSTQLRELAKDLQVSLYTLLLSGYFLMLRSYSYQDDLVIGTPIANRHYTQVENIIGFFVNSLALRIKIHSKEPIADFIQNVGNEIIQAQTYQDLPFEKLVAELNVEKDTSRHPIFQIMFGVQSFGQNISHNIDDRLSNSLDNSCKDDHSLFESYVFNTEDDTAAKFDITTFIDDSQDQLKGMFNYATSLYTEETISQFIETYTEILREIVILIQKSERAAQVSDLRYLPESQYNKVIEVWNQTETEYPVDKTIHSLFEMQVQNTPDAVALVFENKNLTYQQLNEQSNQLAHYLKRIYAIKPDTLCVLCLERSEIMLIGMLAILKAGGAYVPIDPMHPADRIQYIMYDTQSPFILTNEMYSEIKPKLVDEPKHNLSTAVTSTHLAYIIYTSGTTGQPKGVMIEHRSVVNLLSSLDHIYDFNFGSKVAAFSSYTFDPSVKECFVPLLKGGELHLLSERVRKDISEIDHYIAYHKINYLHLPPVLLSHLPQKKYETLHGIIYGGETCDVQSGKYWSNNCNLYNCYGPTETTIEAVHKRVINGDVTVIGTPIANTKCYVLDSNLTPLPIGAIGELYIAGAGLARGYLNHSDLTRQKFIPNSFQTENEKQNGINTRLYKTEDLVRWLPDGNLEYIGRTDFQVKIRGFRIELGEIENVLLSFGDAETNERRVGISQSVVLAEEQFNAENVLVNKYLVAYYVSESKIDEEKILAYLQNKLPEYMIPSVFVHLEQLPLTVNGKVNKRALPKAQLTNKKNFVAPRNEIENNLCHLFSEVLGIRAEEIGIQDDFFKLGGNSIFAIKLVGKINQFYRSHLKLSDLFLHKTIACITPKILHTKDHYQSIIKLNNNHRDPNIFMIHSGGGGCEPYIPLADKLNDFFSCYGIDSYNLYHDEKIDKLSVLAEYYLNGIDLVMKQTQQEEYHLLGWSLGGKIAMEIASILESRGEKKIKLYLLDTIIFTYNTTPPQEQKEEIKKRALAHGHENTYVEKILSVLDAEYKLMKDEISTKLNHTSVLLFKAMLHDPNGNPDKTLNDFILSLQYNHIDTVVHSTSQIRVIPLYESHHGNILTEEERIIEGILDVDFKRNEELNFNQKENLNGRAMSC